MLTSECDTSVFQNELRCIAEEFANFVKLIMVESRTKSAIFSRQLRGKMADPAIGSINDASNDLRNQRSNTVALAHLCRY
jgi:hypothetical protein